MTVLPGQPHSGGTLTGVFRRHHLHSRHIGERDLTVMLPPSYLEDPDREYPILYLQDGQNMFDRRTGFMHREWEADEVALKAMREGRMEEAIIVAVDHGYDSRIAEFTPMPDSEGNGGEADKFLDFMAQEVDPLIRGSYRTDARPAKMAGSSMGGLISLYAGFRHPSMFGDVAPMSASLWWADGALARQLTEAQQKPERIWMDIGDQEGSSDTFGQAELEPDGKFGKTPAGPNGVQDVRDRVREMRQTLSHLGYDDTNLHYEEVAGGTHDEFSWNGRLDRVFTWLLPGPNYRE